MEIIYKKYEPPEHLREYHEKTFKNYFGTVIIRLLFKKNISKTIVKKINESVRNFSNNFHLRIYKVEEVENDPELKIVVDFGVNVFTDKIFVILNFLPLTPEEFIHKLQYGNIILNDIKNILSKVKDEVDIVIEVKGDNFIDIVKESFEKPITKVE